MSASERSVGLANVACNINEQPSNISENGLTFRFIRSRIGGSCWASSADDTVLCLAILTSCSTASPIKAAGVAITVRRLILDISIPNSLHIFEQNLLPAAVIEFCGSAVGVAGDPLSGFKSAVIF